jgi:hypothetical protein
MRFKVGYSFIASIGFLGFLNIFALLYSQLKSGKSLKFLFDKIAVKCKCKE